MIGQSQCKAVCTVLLIIVLSIGLWSTSSRSQVQSCEYPLFLKVGGVDANVLIVFDSSGSMNTAMYHQDYDPDTDYSGNFRNDGTYYVSRNGSYTPRDFNRRYPSSPSAYLVVSDMGTSGEYEGNYMNWIYSHATDTQRAELPRVTRIQVAKAAISDVIDRSTGIRFGIMKFNRDDGGTLIAPVGADKNTLITTLNSIRGESYTPLAETLVDAMNYFKRKDDDAPIQAWCQKSFCIVVTDGYPTQDRDVPDEIGDYDNDGNDPGTCSSVGAPYGNMMDCSDYMDDVALYLFDNDMRPDLTEAKNNVITYTIGFNIDAGILQETADNGGGLYFSANDPAELANSLSEVMASIVTKVSSGTAAAVVSTEDTADDRLFRAKFKPGGWEGYFEAFALPYHDGDAPVWEAGSILSGMNPDSRRIYTTADRTSRLEFRVSNLNALYPYMNIADPDDAESTIEYMRGNPVGGYRDRQGWILGDIVDSSPVIVGKPSYFYEYLDYWEFKAANEGRETVIYVGANDGMLHCFRVATGEEWWAYIPHNQLGKLEALTSPRYCHNFFVNGTPRAVDAHVNGSWKTILIGCEREGGDGYFALDVTDPLPGSVSLMWDVSIPMVNESWGMPEVARIKNLDKFIAFVGSGPDLAFGEAHLIALNLEDGSIVWSDFMSATGTINKATNPIRVDIDYDDYDDLLYVGDLDGNMWRYDLREASWSKTLLFETSQPIQAKPMYTIDESNNVLLYFGTGQYIVPVDIQDTSVQSFYCIIDNHSGLTVSKSDLVDQTSSINPIGTDDRGWYIDLTQAPGERIVETDVIAAGTIYFTSFQPDDAPCKGGGRSWLYYVDVFDGSSPDNDDDTENDTTDERVEHIGDGISSEPVLYMEDEDIVIQDTDSDIVVRDVRGHLRRIIVRAWRQRYQ